ncbi:trypsin-like peptidase domain-containing protein [Synechococcus sp. Cruz-9H2]|uniref:S1 family peptidase n=1 Tax=unclassified Synechococcus TaxID=2626047 RepID=UPI0020CF3F06|nr:MULTISPECIES: serine protease [unclassified Synechococcus]MCP9819880.1 trypsin-like peptidase domain-containing protein [Synechococcus sp. Cruz-9H2]MCP9844054.1 trypsin-like peptidase domain-containing protein [Synechococcus sp. Edmonson 11F2]MCP9856310.1 trypsin-like peptidase domain-containing protein [Synechococcus sp. Cruz-9C9]MCP9863595.1 trypsin-like peptidase domain-containing protein [Synechococcus sp. Cruz-7E5]MCP9870791.1 trypsin-like peptidase domain-containing protein [Synechoco
MGHLSALVVALLLPAASPLLLGAVVTTGSLLVSQAPAESQSAEAVAKVARAITVRIEGTGSPGSGVLVKRDGNRYTVLTAWHVVSYNNSGEELDIYTFDGQRHQLEKFSIRRIGQSDTALLAFISLANYTVASIARAISPAEVVYISGFPLNSPERIKNSTAKIIGYTDCDAQVNDGGLLYKISSMQGEKAEKLSFQAHYESSHKFIADPNQDTRSGMSGGPILTGDGLLIGHHNGGLGGASDWGVSIKMGLNRGSITPSTKPNIANYVNSKAVCEIMNAHSAWLQGRLSDAANFSLGAYRADPKAMLFVSDTLNFTLPKLGRFRELCELRATGAQLNNVSLDYICKGDAPELYMPR